MAKDLESARVGEDGAVPVHKLMQTAQLGDGVLARAHGQVIGIGKHDLGAELLDGLGGDAFDVCLGAHGHKDWRLDVAVRGVQYAGTRVRRRVLGDQIEFKKVLVHKLELLGCGSYADHYTGNQQTAPTRQKPAQRGHSRLRTSPTTTSNSQGNADALAMSASGRQGEQIGMKRGRHRPSGHAALFE